jgi:hypothetical protein
MVNLIEIPSVLPEKQTEVSNCKKRGRMMIERKKRNEKHKAEKN